MKTKYLTLVESESPAYAVFFY